MWSSPVFESPIRASLTLMAAWVLSWMLASFWSGQTAGRLPVGRALLHWAPTVLGAGLLVRSATFAAAAPSRIHPLYGLPTPVGWVLTGIVAAGIAFTWWARVHLGRLWSASVERKEGHRLIDSGPYGVVRHPIYTGLLAALLAMAVQVATPAAYAGVLLIAIGFTVKGLMEEQLLSQALGAEVYAAYQARTPMLIPFAPF
jgi:protein-S-isoprenylcysteine O-methyltransferase Ste14